MIREEFILHRNMVGNVSEKKKVLQEGLSLIRVVSDQGGVHYTEIWWDTFQKKKSLTRRVVSHQGGH